MVTETRKDANTLDISIRVCRKTHYLLLETFLLTCVFLTYVNTPYFADSMDNVQPIIFLSHGGGPSFFLDAKRMPMFKGMDKDSIAADFLRNLKQTVNLKKPEAILVISAHWEERDVTINTNTDHTLHFDYYNFPPETYKLTWPVKGAPEVARKAATRLAGKGIVCREDGVRGLDHGVFVPLKLVFPEADVPGI